jgi:hypothetical protein
MRNFLTLIAASVFLGSCEKEVILDLDQTEPKVVIEAQVTNQPGYQFVKVTRTTDFYSSGATPRITNAVVTVSDSEGSEYTFVHNPNSHPDSAGIYLPSVPFTGVVGRVYTLLVVVDGEQFTATDVLSPVTTMDSLSFQVNELEAKDPLDPGQIYEVLMFAKEPQDQKNYYLFKFFRNDTLNLYNDTDIYYSDDELLAEEINGVPSPAYFKGGDTARVEMYSISRVGFVYYNDLWSLLNNDAGGMFGPIPAAPRTNISNGALGFFQVSAVDISEIVISP